MADPTGEKITQDATGRLAVRPGLTGLAQVSGRNDLSWADRIELDLEYVTRQSLRLDLGLVARTAGALIGGTGTTAADDPIATVEAST